MLFVGIDTSAYTTSIGVVDGAGQVVLDKRQILKVPLGSKGLRQSDAVFAHIKNVCAMLEKQNILQGSSVAAVCVSAKPRPDEDSYMPVFLVGKMLGEAISAFTGADYIELTHQHGHIAAAMCGKHLEFEEFLALHISGGTTELLRVSKQGNLIGEIRRLGGTLDISAGQLIDRIGVKLGLAFPSGPYVEQIAERSQNKLPVKTSVKGMNCNLSGLENLLEGYIKGGEAPEDVCMCTQRCVGKTLGKLVQHAVEQTGLQHILVFGGVASNEFITQYLSGELKGKIHLHFALAQYASDNSLGLALQAREHYLVKVRGQDQTIV